MRNRLKKKRLQTENLKRIKTQKLKIGTKFILNERTNNAICKVKWFNAKKGYGFITDMKQRKIFFSMYQH